MKKNEPRTCDIDIIDYNGKIIDFTYQSLIFKVPHEKLIYRSFVLFPLQYILLEQTHAVVLSKTHHKPKRNFISLTGTCEANIILLYLIYRRLFKRI